MYRNYTLENIKVLEKKYETFFSHEKKIHLQVHRVHCEKVVISEKRAYIERYQKTDRDFKPLLYDK